MSNDTKQYTWKPGDTFHLIAYKYRRGNQYSELIDHNKILLSENNYLMRPGDQIEIPDSWFPLPDYSFTTKFKGSHGERSSI